MQWLQWNQLTIALITICSGMMTDSAFKSADIDHADFKLSVHRFIIKFTVSPNSDLVVTDSDTSDNLEANSTINFGNIKVG